MVWQNQMSMKNDRGHTDLDDLSRHFGETRTLHDGDGRPHEIYARRVTWEILDYLVAGWNYPAHEMLDDLARSYGADQVQRYFERNILYAITAQNWVRYGGANDNLFSHPLDEVVPASHAVWHAHLPRSKWSYRLPRIKMRGRPRG